MAFECPHCGSTFLGQPRGDRCPSCGLAHAVGPGPQYQTYLQRLYDAAGRITVAGWLLLVASIAVTIWLAAEVEPQGGPEVVIVLATGIPMIALSTLVIAAGIGARLVVLARRIPPSNGGE